MDWAILSDFPKYEINGDGLVRNCETKHVQKQWTNKKTGEIYYLLINNKMQSRQKAYELVAKTFLPNPNRWTRIIFKDGNKTNCSVQNLEWAEDIVDNQTWDTIKGFDTYEITRTGQIRNKITKQLIGGNTNDNGYNVVYLRKDGKPYHKFVHILVAEQYIENPEHKPIVNHIDQNPGNNSVENLEWVTVKQNNQHGTRGNKIGARVSRPINEYDLSGKYIRTWVSSAAFSRHYGVNECAAKQVITGAAYTVAGRQVRFYEGNIDDIAAVSLNNYSRKYDYEKAVPPECLYIFKSERELVMEAIESPLKGTSSGKTKELNAKIIKTYIDKLEREIEALKKITSAECK